ncbi:MAG: hypothetical protein CL932_01130, partial [Deltaproteobacteria bacterium]|nr:hypothetical protein [Deltaproteobacteria bacterium]
KAKVIQGELAGKARLRGSCIAPLVDRSKAKVIQGELAGKARLRGSCIAPLANIVELQRRWTSESSD